MADVLFANKVIAVAAGGYSAEREISLKSGAAVFAALERSGAKPLKYDPKEQSLSYLIDEQVTHVWNALHGRGGEDGQFQGALEFLGISYTGSGVEASALAMDKWRSKLIWQALGLPVASYRLVQREQTITASLLESLVNELGTTLFVKPSHEGSSVGMSKVNDPAELEAALRLAFIYDEEVLVESFVNGSEYTVALLNDKVLPSIRLETPRDFYDFEAKYMSTETEYYCPSGLSEEDEIEIGKLARKAFTALGCSGWGRVDFIYDQLQSHFVLLEANTVPGMTESSLVPKAAKQAGITFESLCCEILHSASSEAKQNHA